MSRWLVTGAGGMLGRDLVIALERRGETVTGLNHNDLDVTDSAAVGSAVGRNQPDVIVNCAAWTAVDDAELREDQALIKRREQADVSTGAIRQRSAWLGAAVPAAWPARRLSPLR